MPWKKRPTRGERPLMPKFGEKELQQKEDSHPKKTLVPARITVGILLR